MDWEEVKGGRGEDRKGRSEQVWGGREGVERVNNGYTGERGRGKGGKDEGSRGGKVSA